MGIPPREGYKTYTLTQVVNYASLKRTLDTTKEMAPHGKKIPNINHFIDGH